jgi:hypothetical protein
MRAGCHDVGMRPAPDSEHPSPTAHAPPPRATTGAATPFDRAWRFVADAARLTSDEWGRVARRAHALDAATYRAACGALDARRLGHLQSRALDALARAAAAAAAAAGDREPEVTADAVRGFAEVTAARAAAAIALSGDLPARVVATLTAPFGDDRGAGHGAAARDASWPGARTTTDASGRAAWSGARGSPPIAGRTRSR